MLLGTVSTYKDILLIIFTYLYLVSVVLILVLDKVSEYSLKLELL